MARVYFRFGLVTVSVLLIAGCIWLYRRSTVKPLPSSASVSTDPMAHDSANPFHRTLSSAEKQHVLDGACTVIPSAQALPQPVKNAFATITGAKPFALAEPGAAYQMTDVVEKPGLARRRLIFAGVCKDRWFIHYERGGIGVSTTALRS